MDLIAAIATGSAATAIGIIRLSGDGCFAACDRVFRPRNGRPFADQPSHKMVFGEMLDETGAVRSRRPFKKARRVNSPGPACRAPAANRAESSSRSTTGDPWQ